MKTYTLGKSAVQVPSAWDELTQEQFLSLVSRLQQYNSGAISIAECRVLWICDIIGIDIKKLPAGGNAADNLYFMSRGVTFPFSVKYEEGKLDSVSADIRKLAKKTPPEDLPYSLETAYLRKLPYQYVADVVFCRNLIPVVEVGGKEYRGYIATCDDGVFDTSLTALQYITASELLNAVGNGAHDKLPVLCAVLYGGDVMNKNAFKELSPEVVSAIVLNFQAFISFLFTKTEFSILWRSRKQTKGGSITLTGIDTLYDLSTTGYGTPDQVESMPLLKYLRIVKKNLISSVNMLRDMGKDDIEIAEKTGLPINIITQIA